MACCDVSCSSFEKSKDTEILRDPDLSLRGKLFIFKLIKKEKEYSLFDYSIAPRDMS